MVVSHLKRTFLYFVCTVIVLVCIGTLINTRSHYEPSESSGSIKQFNPNDITETKTTGKLIKTTTTATTTTTTATTTTTRAKPTVEPSLVNFFRREFPASSQSINNECPLFPQSLLNLDSSANLNFRHEDSSTPPSWSQLRRLFDNATDDNGGWSPSWCRQTQRLAVLVAYRNREGHLRRLLWHLHKLLPMQAANYRIFVIEQAGQQVFNRGAVFNAGFKEAVRHFNATCLVLHDVDMVPEVPQNLYRCGRRPRLLSSALNKFKYNIVYSGYFGGTVAIATDQFVKINGFSNKFWGWGGEDDNFRQRLHWTGIRTVDTPIKLGRFNMAKHDRDASNQVNPKRFELLKENKKIWKKDGLSNIKYRRLHTANSSKLFQLIRIELEGPPASKSVLHYPLLMG